MAPHWIRLQVLFPIIRAIAIFFRGSTSLQVPTSKQQAGPSLGQFHFISQPGFIQAILANFWSCLSGELPWHPTSRSEARGLLSWGERWPIRQCRRGEPDPLRRWLFLWEASWVWCYSSPATRCLSEPTWVPSCNLQAGTHSPSPRIQGSILACLKSLFFSIL